MTVDNAFYKIKIGETPDLARKRWTYFLIQDLSRKMSMKNPPGIEFIGITQKLLYGFPDNVIWTFFEEAPTEFKYFPKPAEIKQKLLDIDLAIKKKNTIPNQGNSIFEAKECTGCDSYGNAVMENEDGARFVYSCTKCENGKKQRAAPDTIGVTRGHKPVWKGRLNPPLDTPWPNAVIGLIMGVDDPRGISPWGMQTLGIDETEARYLYDCWKRGEWENEWAKEIIAKHKTYKPKSFAYYE